MSYDKMTVSVTIDDVDVTDFIKPGTLKIKSVLTSQIDTLEFTLEDAGSLDLNGWQDVVLQDAGVDVFTGVLTKFDELDGDGLAIDYKVTCRDNAALMDTPKTIKKEYFDMTDAAIIADLFATYMPEINAVTHVEAIATHTKIRFNRCSLREAVGNMAKYAGADWYVDQDKKLHYFDTEENTADISLSDSPDFVNTFGYSNFKIKNDASQICNRVEVVGGFYNSDDTTFLLPGTGQSPQIALPFKMHAPSTGSSIEVYRNDGTEGAPVWTQLTVKTAYVDQLGGADEVLFYFQEKQLELQSNWPVLTNACKVVASYEVPLRARVTDAASFSKYGGRWIDEVIVNNDIIDKATAKKEAKALMAKRASETVAISLNTRQPGLRAGELLPVKNTKRGIDTSYMIHKATTVIGIDGAVKVNLELGHYSPDLVDLIVSLARDAKPKPLWRDDEVLDDLLQVQDSLQLTELYTVTTGGDTPYLWDAVEWDFFTWD